MAMLSQPAFGPRVALAYITSGALLDVWTAVWYFAFGRPGPLENTTWFWLVSFFLTGLTFIVLGLLLGPIGQAARKAELPPSEAMHAEAQIQQTAAATPQPVVAPTPPPAAVNMAVPPLAVPVRR